MNFLATVEMTEVWGISSNRVALLCSQGRAGGATVKGKTWLIHTKKTEELCQVRKKGQ